eukprot:1221720-Prymnesium_polylepis.1
MEQAPKRPGRFRQVVAEDPARSLLLYQESTSLWTRYYSAVSILTGPQRERIWLRTCRVDADTYQNHELKCS